MWLDINSQPVREKLIEISMRPGRVRTRPGHVLKIHILQDAEPDHRSRPGILRTLNRTFGSVLKRSGSDVGSGRDFMCPSNSVG